MDHPLRLPPTHDKTMFKTHPGFNSWTERSQALVSRFAAQNPESTFKVRVCFPSSWKSVWTQISVRNTPSKHLWGGNPVPIPGTGPHAYRRHSHISPPNHLLLKAWNRGLEKWDNVPTSHSHKRQKSAYRATHLVTHLRGLLWTLTTHLIRCERVKTFRVPAGFLGPQ